MSNLNDMRKELRELRKESGHRPISKMKKADVAHELERLRERRESTPPVASTHGAASRKMAPRAADIHESKEAEHPVKPVAVSGTKKGEERKTARKAFEGETPSKKKDLMAKMMKMLEEME